MNRRTFVLIWIVILALGLVACSPLTSSTTATAVASSSWAASVSCVFKNFQATVFHGPDAGLSVQGDLHVQVDAAGNVIAFLKRTKGSDVPVVGQATGRAINLLFDLGHDKLLFGVGTLQHPLSECKGAVGGPLEGPQEGDSGDWGSKPGPPV